MVAVTRYTAHVTREGRDWLAEVADLPGAHAYARTLERLRREIATAITLAADLPDDTVVDVELTTDADNDLHNALQLGRRRRDVEAQLRDVTDQTAEITRHLIDRGYSVRDVAGALNITAGRVSQLHSKANESESA